MLMAISVHGPKLVCVIVLTLISNCLNINYYA